MHYRSLLFSGVFITAIASLLIVQSCTKQVQAGAERDRESTTHDRELGYVSAQALYYLNMCDMEIQKPGQKPNCNQYKQYRSTLENWCKSNDRDACNMLLSLQKLEGQMEINRRMQRLIG